MLSEWQRGTRILLHANPDYRGFTWDFASIGESLGQGCRRRDEGQTDAADRRRRRSLDRGGTVALARLPGRRDRLHRPLRLVLADGDSQQQGRPRSRQARHSTLSLSRTGDDVLLLQHAGPGLRRIQSRRRSRLRRAITMSYDIEEEIRVIRKNQAIRAESPIPPGVVGYDPTYRNRSDHYDPGAGQQATRLFRLQARCRRTTARYPTASRWSLRCGRDRRQSAANTTSCGSKISRDRHSLRDRKDKVRRHDPERPRVSADVQRRGVDCGLARSPTISCSSRTARTSARPTTRATSRQPSTIIIVRPRNYPTRPNATASIVPWLGRLEVDSRLGYGCDALQEHAVLSRGCKATRSTRSCTRRGRSWTSTRRNGQAK